MSVDLVLEENKIVFAACARLAGHVPTMVGTEIVWQVQYGVSGCITLRCARCQSNLCVTCWAQDRYKLSGCTL